MTIDAIRAADQQILQKINQHAGGGSGGEMQPRRATMNKTTIS